MSLAAPVDWDTETRALGCSSEEEEATLQTPTKKRLLVGSLLLAASAAMYFGRTPGQADVRPADRIDSTAIIQDHTARSCASIAKQCDIGEQEGFKVKPGMAIMCGMCKKKAEEAQATVPMREWEKEGSKNKIHLYNIDPTLWFVLLNEDGKAGRCPGTPPFGWANLGKSITQKECESECGKKEDCKYFSYNAKSKACTQFETCEELMPKSFFSAWSKVHVDRDNLDN